MENPLPRKNPNSGGSALSIPNGKAELILIMTKEFYLSKKILPILQRLKLEVKEAGATTKEDVRKGEGLLLLIWLPIEGFLIEIFTPKCSPWSIHTFAKHQRYRRNFFPRKYVFF